MKALIISLGGSPAPIRLSIETHKPDFVCFFTSEQCVEDIGQIKREVNHTFEDRKVVISDINDLAAAYERALKCSEIVEAQGFEPHQVVVDYTGGTKSIAGALILATIARGYSFSYVGGQVRDKEGKGNVLDGSSEVHTGFNPWDVLATDERRRLAWAFNHSSFEVAKAILEDVLPRTGLSGRVRGLFKALAPLADAYHWWDRFEHEKIRDSLKTGLEALRSYREMCDDRSLDGFVSSVESNLEFYNKFRQDSKNFKERSRYHIADLIGNAVRRANEGRFDDAIARLYRALEMSSQVALQNQKPSLMSDAVPLNAVPEELQDEYKLKYLDTETKMLKLPLFASFNLLAAKGDPLGAKFLSNFSEFKKILSARNQSILAHGVTVYDQAAFDSFLTKLEVLDLDPWPRFPRL